MVLETLMELCVTKPHVFKNIFGPNIGQMDQKLATNPLLRKSLVLKIYAKIKPRFFARWYKFRKIKSVSKIAWLGMVKIWVWLIWSLDSLKSTISQEWTGGINCLHAGTNPRKLKDDWNFLEWTWSKKGLTSLVTGF